MRYYGLDSFLLMWIVILPFLFLVNFLTNDNLSQVLGTLLWSSVFFLIFGALVSNVLKVTSDSIVILYLLNPFKKRIVMKFESIEKVYISGPTNRGTSSYKFNVKNGNVIEVTSVLLNKKDIRQFTEELSKNDIPFEWFRIGN